MVLNINNKNIIIGLFRDITQNINNNIIKKKRGVVTMGKNNSKIDKNNLEKVSSGKGEKKLSKKKIFKETGRIIANPLIHQNHDYFYDN